MIRPLVAVDLGATSGRVVVALIADGSVEFQEVHRFANDPIMLPDGLHWNITEIYRQIMVGLREVARSYPPAISVGVDSWAVDYGLLDREGRLVGIPYHYRDERTEAGVRRVHAAVAQDELYRRSGLQFLPFNSIYQLEADLDSGLLDHATTVLLVPDLIAYWLTGQRVAELTNASTTGLLGIRTHDWDQSTIDALGFARGLFPGIREPGTVIGPLLPSVRDGTDLSTSTVVTLVGSHDTASAFVAVPATDRRAAIISCGTWALIGQELDRPVANDAARLAGFTNETGVDGTVRFLHNVMGMWLLEECVRDWRDKGMTTDLPTLLAEAATFPLGGPTIDPNDPQLFAPGAMPDRIAAACGNSGQPAPANPPQIVRCVIDSLAETFAETIRRVEQLSGIEVEVIHLVGGGSRNELLCRLTAHATGRPVLAGPAEAAAWGNILVQARTHGLISGSLADLRQVVLATEPVIRYEPLAIAASH